MAALPVESAKPFTSTMYPLRPVAVSANFFSSSLSSFEIVELLTLNFTVASAFTSNQQAISVLLDVINVLLDLVRVGSDSLLVARNRLLIRRDVLLIGRDAFFVAFDGYNVGSDLLRGRMQARLDHRRRF